MTYQVNLKKFESAINSRTCLLVGSAPTYPHGMYDNIEQISNMAVKYGEIDIYIITNVDQCL